MRPKGQHGERNGKRYNQVRRVVILFSLLVNILVCVVLAVVPDPVDTVGAEIWNAEDEMVTVKCAADFLVLQENR